MIITQDCNLIAERVYENELFKYPRYKAGDKDADKGVYKGPETEKYPTLLLEDDLINKDGYGIRKGFYKVVPDSEHDFLNFYQAGEIKAKIPIISVEKINREPTKKISKWKKRQIKNKGILPEDYIYSKVDLFYNNKTDDYLLIWEFKDVKIKGVIKL